MGTMSTQVLAPYVVAGELETIKADLRKYYSEAKQKRFVVGWGGYEPFVSANGRFRDAPLLPLFKLLAKELDLKLVRKKTTWRDFPRLLQEHAIDTMLEPIIRTRRGSYVVVPYMTITAAVLLFPEETYEIVGPAIRSVRKLTKDFKDGLVPDAKYDMDLGRLLEFIARQSRSQTIGVTRGVLEEDLLIDLGFQPEKRAFRRMASFPPEDIVRNAMTALGRGMFFFAEKRSAELAQDRLAKRGRRVRVMDVFETNLGAQCGFAVNPAKQALAKYFTYISRFALERIQTLLLAGIPRSMFNGDHFGLMKREQIDRPITRYALFDFVRPVREPDRLRARGGQFRPPSVAIRRSGDRSRRALRQADAEPGPEMLAIKQMPYQDVMALTTDWASTNTRRLILIDRKLDRVISAEEEEELARLQELAAIKRELVLPLPMRRVEQIEIELRRSGLWRGE